MRMRRKKHGAERIAACSEILIPTPITPAVHPQSFFSEERPVCLEIGCGKGVSTAAMVYDNQDINFIAMDITCNVLGDTRRNIAKTYGEQPVKNAMITRYNIEDIRKVFAPEDRVERIYINFCNPWNEKAKQHKRRLTHPRQLMQYRDFLAPGGEIWFMGKRIDVLTPEQERYLNESGI